MLQPPGSPQRIRFDATLRDIGADTRLNITESASNLLTIAMLAISDMVAIMPASLAEHYLRQRIIRVLSIDLSMRLTPIYLITLHDHSLSPAAAHFVAQLRREFVVFTSEACR